MVTLQLCLCLAPLIPSAIAEPPEVGVMSQLISAHRSFLPLTGAPESTSNSVDEQRESTLILASFEKAEDEAKKNGEEKELEESEHRQRSPREPHGRSGVHAEKHHGDHEHGPRKGRDEEHGEEQEHALRRGKSKPEMSMRNDGRAPRPDHRGDEESAERSKENSGDRPDSKPPGFPMFWHGPMMGHGSMMGHGPMVGHGKPPFGGPAAFESTGPFGNLVFELLDNNQDGQLSRDEFQRLMMAVEKSHRPGSAFPAPAFRNAPGGKEGPRSESRDPASRSMPGFPPFRAPSHLREARRLKPESRFDGRPMLPKRPAANDASQTE